MCDDDDDGVYIYVAYCHDRHRDAELFAFYDLEVAIEHTRAWFEESVAHPSHIEERTVKGYEFYLGYGDEEDRAYVVKVPLC